jgi:hypothetical protein
MDEPGMGRRQFQDGGDEDMGGSDFDMGQGHPQMDMPDIGPPSNEFPPEDFDEQ